MVQILYSFATDGLHIYALERVGDQNFWLYYLAIVGLFVFKILALCSRSFRKLRLGRS